MDKFGIFKLLNSFFNFYEQNKNGSPSEKGETATPNLANLLGNLQQNNDGVTAPSQKAPPPLQSSMLSVMNSHDEFVKRVKSKNKP